MQNNHTFVLNNSLSQVPFSNTKKKNHHLNKHLVFAQQSSKYFKNIKYSCASSKNH